MSLGSAAIALAAAALKDKIEAFKAIGGVAGTLVSAFCLPAIAIMNIFVLTVIYRTFRRVMLGYVIVGIFLATWAVSVLIYRWMGYVRLEPSVGGSEVSE